MVIAKGEEWGERVHKQGVVCTRSDHDVFLDLAFPVKGDIAHTIGSELRQRSALKQFASRVEWHQLPFDVIEIDIDGAEATENLGMLTIKLPKIDKGKQAKLRVMKSLGN